MAYWIIIMAVAAGGSALLVFNVTANVKLFCEEMLDHYDALLEKARDEKSKQGLENEREEKQ